MEIQGIQIFAGKPDFEYEPIRRLEVKCEASHAFMPAPTVDEANGRLRTMAAKVGANAIVEAEYSSGVSLTSWKSMKATGLAVRKIADEVACPFCAETIKRAAVKCRHCGSPIERASQVQHTSTQDVGETVAGSAPAMPEQEPLRESNNPAIIIGLLMGAALLFIILAGSL